MKSKAEIYRELRERVKELRQIQGEVTTNDLIKAFDKTWRTLVKIRNTIFENINFSSNEIPIFDFYSIYYMIDPDQTGARKICRHCLSSVSNDLVNCLYCDNEMSDEPDKKEITIDFDLPDAAPDWDINYDPKEILEKNKPVEVDGIPEIKPCTQRDDIPGPNGVQKYKRSRQKKLSDAAWRLITWNRKKLFGSKIPYTPEELSRLGERDLKTIVAVIPCSKRDDVLKTVPEKIRFILGHQGEKPIDPGPAPYGNIPEFHPLEEILDA
jgi:hypothetical protein